MTLEQAAHLAGLDSYEFQKLIGDRKIPFRYTQVDFEDDTETIKKYFQ